MASRLPRSAAADHAGRAQALDLLGRETHLAQDLARVLAERRRAARAARLDALEAERHREGERHVGIVGLDDRLRGARLRIVDEVLDPGDRAEDHALGHQSLAPDRPVLLRKNLIEHARQRCRVRAPLGRGREARIVLQLGTLDHAAQPRPEAFLHRQRDREPAPVLAQVAVAERAARALARRTQRQGGADERRLHGDAVRPQPRGEQRGRHPAAAPAAAAAHEREQDRRDQRHRGGAVARRRHREMRRLVLVAVDVEEAAAREVGRRIEPRLVALRPGLAEAGERGIDQPWMRVAQVLPAQAHAFAQLERKVRHQHVGARDQALERGASFGMVQIEGDGALVARVHFPGIVDRALRIGVRSLDDAIRIADARAARP